VIAERYPRLLAPALRSKLKRGEKAKLSPGDYARVSASMRGYFGSYAGYAQQYLFMAAREPEA
jgi:3-methyladenine DNA glycosylase/8-oxoguanine DNA glycosylase